jgi:hypothetical protein
MSSKKTIMSAYFTRQRFTSVEPVPETKRFNSVFFGETFLLNIVQFVSVFRPKMQAQGYWMHIDNARSHNSALSFQKIEKMRFTQSVQPSYSLI